MASKIIREISHYHYYHLGEMNSYVNQCMNDVHLRHYMEYECLTKDIHSTIEITL